MRDYVRQEALLSLPALRRCERDRCNYLHSKTLAALDEYLSEDKVVELAAAAYAQYQQEEQVDERPALERELKTVENQIQNAVNAIVSGTALPELQDKIAELKERQESLRMTLLEMPAPIPRLTEDHFRLALSMMAKQSSAELFKTVVGLVLLKGDTVILCVNLTDETNVPPLEQILFRVTDVSAPVTLNTLIQISGWMLIAA